MTKRPVINGAGDRKFLLQQTANAKASKCVSSKGWKVRAGKGVGDKLREIGSSHITKSQNSAFGLYSKVICKQKNTIEKDDNARKDILENT